jgi:orotidine-5'-phosphate decarboxylase
VDLKFFDIPNTVRGAVASAVRAGARMVNIHTLGGARMAEAAREGLEAAPPGGRPLLLGVTVLTSMADEDLDLLAAGRSASELAVVLAGRAKAYYLDGVVCSGLEIRAVKRACGEGFCCLTPGIRPFAQEGGKAGDDQRRVVTAERAAGDGADYLVVGRPITAADDPLLAARNVLEMIERGERAREREP